MSQAKRVTMDNRKNPEYHAAAAIRKRRTEKTVPQKTRANHIKNEQHIGSEETYGPKKYWTVKHVFKLSSINLSIMEDKQLTSLKQES